MSLVEKPVSSIGCLRPSELVLRNSKHNHAAPCRLITFANRRPSAITSTYTTPATTVISMLGSRQTTHLTNSITVLLLFTKCLIHVSQDVKSWIPASGTLFLGRQNSISSPLSLLPNTRTCSRCKYLVSTEMNSLSWRTCLCNL